MLFVSVCIYVYIFIFIIGGDRIEFDDFPIMCYNLLSCCYL